MKPRKNRRIITFLKALPLVICIIFIAFFLVSGNDITVQTVLSYTPESPFAAAVVILLLYALKSVSFVFPIAVLQIATGHLFQTPIALFINFSGRAITLAIPYWIGHFSGSDAMKRLGNRKPDIKVTHLAPPFATGFSDCRISSPETPRHPYFHGIFD